MLLTIGFHCRSDSNTFMVFNSIPFLIFCAIIFPLYYLSPFRRQNLILVVASYVFYGWWDWRFTGLLFATTATDFWLAQKISETEDRALRKKLLIISMTMNLTVLGIFKYFNFFSATLQSALHGIGVVPDWPTLNVILPLGISFYTFLSMSYTIDVYRRELAPAKRFLDFALFVSYFPHLVAGPIVRASFLLPQCEKPRVVQSREVVNGLWLILIGLVKKIVIADRLGQIANAGFSGQTPPVADANAWWFVLAFAFQIYGDFSGYSDMARGLAKTMGFELPVNFGAPYLVAKASDFWKHWHISLSTWLRDYLYIPLGGNRKGRARTYRNLMFTMFLGGLWHGAGAAYVLWGVYHGTLLGIQRAWSESSAGKLNPGRWLRGTQIFLFFGLTCIGWLIFRAGSCAPGVQQNLLVWNYLNAMVTPVSTILPIARTVIVLGMLGMLFQFAHEQCNRFVDWPSRWQVAGVCAGVALLCVMGVFQGSQFIYFQF